MRESACCEKEEKSMFLLLLLLLIELLASFVNQPTHISIHVYTYKREVFCLFGCEEATAMGVIEWFEAKLDASECAEVKRLFLDGGAAGIVSCCEFSQLLCMCRIIVADQRVVWEHLSPSFTSSFRWPADPWNEQLAVKLLRAYIESMDDAETASQLREELIKHLTVTLRPIVVSSMPFTTPKENAEKPVDCPYRVAPASADVEGSLMCNSSLSEFGDLLRIPRKRMFFIDTVVEYSALGRAVNASSELTGLLGGEEPLLILALLYERYVEESSHWHELLSSCPSTYPTLPSCWDLEDLAQLEGLDVLDDVLAKRVRLIQFHSEVVGILPRIFEALSDFCGLEESEFLGRFTVEAVMWARATFDSRAFNLNVDGRLVLALVPVADMINHSNRTDVLTRMVEPNGGDFVMQIGAPLTAEDIGRELWMSYGPLQNWELLQFYGFVMEDNEHDKLPFPFTFPGTDDEEDDDDDNNNWNGRRAELVRKYALHLVGRCWIGYDGRPPPALVALLRVYLAEADEFSRMERDGPFVRVSADTELRIINTIAETVRCILGLSGTSLEEDESLLCEAGNSTAVHAEEDAGNENVLSRNKRLSLLLRVGLKRIAHRSLEWCSTAAASV